MAKMRTIDAAVRVLEMEGVVCAFGVPGAAINPLYSALKMRGSIRPILTRHALEGARALGLSLPGTAVAQQLFSPRAWRQGVRPFSDSEGAGVDASREIGKS